MQTNDLKKPDVAIYETFQVFNAFSATVLFQSVN